MSLEQVAGDAMLHFGAGIAFALGDYATHRVWGEKKAERIETKKQVLESIDYILRANQGTVVLEQGDTQVHDSTREAPGKDTLQYGLNVEAVKQYLHGSGLVKMNLPLGQRISSAWNGIIKDEKLNKMGPKMRLGFTLGAEILYDSLFGFHYYTTVLQMSPVAALSTNLYQIPAFWLGLTAGKGVRNVVNFASTAGEERRLDKTIAETLKKTDLADIVTTYVPPVQVQQELEAKGFTTKAILAAREKATALLGYATQSTRHYIEGRKEQREQERAAVRSRFDELTKGH